MNTNSRINNSKRNFVIITISHVFLLLISFVSRTVFIKSFGDYYLGLNSLFLTVTNILSIFNFGCNAAILFILYKPIYDKDTKKIAGIIGYFRKIYNFIALLTLIAGLIAIPIIVFVSKIEDMAVLKYYIVYLLSASINYIVIMKTFLFTADQKNYVVVIFTTLFSILKSIVQIILMLSNYDYLWYVIILLVFSFMQYLFCSMYANKKYPFIRNKVPLDKETKQYINKNIKSMVLIQTSTIILSYTTILVISLLNGVISVGHYSNYMMIVDNINTFIVGVFTAVAASVGNLISSNDDEKKYKIYSIMNTFAILIYGFCSICFLVLFDDFITLWIGTGYILEKSTLIAIVINFLIIGLFRPTIVYREGMGTFNKSKYLLLFTCIVNIFLCYFMGLQFGISGILLAPVISRIIFYYWYEVLLINRKFNKNTIKFLGKLCLELLAIVICAFIIVSITSLITFTPIINLVIKILLVMVLFVVLIMLLFIKNNNFRYILGVGKNTIFKKGKNK